MRSFKPTPATVLALLALVFALTGTGLAAKSYVISSSSQIKDGAITGQDIKKATITGTNVKDKSLTPADFNGSLQGPAGPQGATGTTGAKGEKGDKGDPGYSPVTYFVQVHADASFGRSFGVNGADAGHWSTGYYSIGFWDKVSECAVMTSIVYGIGDDVGAARGGRVDARVDPCCEGYVLSVHTTDAAGADADRPFHVAVGC